MSKVHIAHVLIDDRLCTTTVFSDVRKAREYLRLIVEEHEADKHLTQTTIQTQIVTTEIL